MYLYASQKQPTKGALSCSTCGGDFAGRDEHREHFRSEWHRFNLKRKLKKLPAMSEQEFNEVDEEELSSFLNEVL